MLRIIAIASKSYQSWGQGDKIKVLNDIDGHMPKL